MQGDNIYEIVGRVKNLMAKEDLSLTGAGEILSNSYALMLKELHDFANTLPEEDRFRLKELLFRKEDLPCYVIKLCTPKEAYPKLMPLPMSEEILEELRSFPDEDS